MAGGEEGFKGDYCTHFADTFPTRFHHKIHNSDTLDVCTCDAVPWAWLRLCSVPRTLAVTPPCSLPLSKASE